MVQRMFWFYPLTVTENSTREIRVPQGLLLNKVILVDINECDAGLHSCDGNATCTNTVGSYTCSCNTGFGGNGYNCSGIIKDNLNKTYSKNQI